MTTAEGFKFVFHEYEIVDLCLVPYYIVETKFMYLN